MAKTITTGMLSAAVNGIQINTSLPCNSSNYADVSSRSVSYVVMHYTGNSKDLAKSNATYFQGANRGASAHFFVDDTTIYQSVELRDRAWHCGDTTYYHSSCRNTNSIGIEMCCTAGNYKISDTTKENGAQLCAYICKLLGITAAQVDTYVLRHWDVTHKSCPAQMAGTNNAEWTAFKDRVKAILGGTATTTTTTANTSTGSQLYRVRKTWADASSQIGAYASLDNAKAACKTGYKVFDSNGSIVYDPAATTTTTTTTTTETTTREEFDVAKTYQNGSTAEPVYADTGKGTKIGSLNPWETCDCLGKAGNMYIVRYQVDGTSTYKVGVVAYSGGVSA